MQKHPKHREIILSLIDLYVEESKLLHETRMAMITLKNKSTTTKKVIDRWLKKVEGGHQLTQSQGKAIEKALTNWVKDEDEIKRLHDAWNEFHEKTQKFKIVFEQSTVLKSVCKLMCIIYTV